MQIRFLFVLKIELWLAWLSGFSAGLRNKGLLVQIPRVHAWVGGQVLSRGCVRSNLTLMFLFLTLPLSKNKLKILKKIETTINTVIFKGKQ